MRKLIWALIVLPLFIISIGVHADSDPCPVNGWTISTPEEQGMDSTKLLAMLKMIKMMGLRVDSALIVRHGRLVMEAYFYPYNRDTKHVMHSVTKSFTSTLIGLAIKDGAIRGVDQSIGDFFPGLSSDKSKITVDNLLTMSPGLAWDEHTVPNSDSRNSIAQMILVKDRVAFVLSRPMNGTPGKTFNYNTGASHLLSAILQKATGKRAADYARERLFTPMGIADFDWDSDAQGITNGGFGLYLKPTDMAKFGYLFLHEGQWNGSQVIPADWVRTATAKHVENDNFSDWGPDNASGYGYQWWMNPYGGYSAQGHSGQYIIVIPQYDLVIVFTSDLPDWQVHAPLRFVEQYILPAIQSDSSIPPNPDAVGKLRACEQRLETP